MKIAIIGAGMAGLVATKYSKSHGLDVTCYEQTSEIGGTWVYNEQGGIDLKSGQKIHSSMYKNLKTNLPKQVMSFSDFEMKIPLSYTNSNETLNFLQKYAEKFNLNENIKLKHRVMSVIPIEEGKWNISVLNASTQQTSQSIFDAVFICNGHYSEPRLPEIHGIEYFKGDVIHSHEYRVPEVYSGKIALVIGGGVSGVDVTNDVSSTAQQVYFSHHFGLMLPGFANTVHQKPDVSKVLEDGRVEFKDGTSEFVDSIIYCTGYLYSFPFLTPNCGINVEDNHITTLYKHIVNINCPTMFFIGMPFITIITFMVEFQVQFALHFLLNSEKRPSKSEMVEDFEKDLRTRLSNGTRKKEMHRLGIFEDMANYFDFLADFAGVPKMKSVHEKLIKAAYSRILSDPLGFRKYNYKIINDEDFVDEVVGETN